MPRESLDAPENLPKERRRQGALGQLEDEVAGMSDEAPAGLEQPLLEAMSPTTMGARARRMTLPQRESRTALPESGDDPRQRCRRQAQPEERDERAGDAPEARLPPDGNTEARRPALRVGEK